MIKKITAEKLLEYLGNYLQLCLKEIEEHPERNQDGFITGQYYAFIECLEILTLFWDKALLYGLDFVPEEKYKLD